MIKQILQVTGFVLAVMLCGCQGPKSSAPAGVIKNAPVEKNVQAGPATPNSNKIAPSSNIDENGTTVIAYYFYRTIRCHTCLVVEAGTERAIKNNFPQQIANKRLMWIPFNMDDPGGKEFKKEFDLSGSTLVIAKMRDGKVIKFKKLEKVWQFADDEQSLSKYVTTQINEYLNGK